MVQADIDTHTGNGTIVLKPNNSSTWRFNLIVLSSLSLFALIISVFFLLQGLWMILPFSGLELILLYFCLSLCAHKNSKTEVIIFHHDIVSIEKGRTYLESAREYQRSWAKIYIKMPEYRGHPKRIFICSHGKELELGAFLNKQDKEKLISSLKNIVYYRRPAYCVQPV